MLYVRFISQDMDGCDGQCCWQFLKWSECDYIAYDYLINKKFHDIFVTG
jgi:hypothetical protein